MELYLTYNFYRSFHWFFIDTDAYFNDKDKSPELIAFAKRHSAILNKMEPAPDLKTLTEMVDMILASPYVHREHLDEHLRLISALPGLSREQILNLYAVLFSIRDAEMISYPAYEVLEAHYPEIFADIAKRGDVPVIFQNRADADRFEAAVYETLADYVLRFCPVQSFAVWGVNYDDGSEPQPPKEGHIGEEFEELDCYVHIADTDTVDRLKNAAYAPGYYSTDVDRGVFLIGNMITVADETLADAVTLQTLEHIRFDSYEEMYRTLGTAAFGYAGRTPEACAEETEALFEQYYPEGPMALRVRTLPFPILSEADFEELKHRCGSL